MKLITFESNGQLRTGALGADNAMVDVTSAGTAIQIATDAVARAKADALLASGPASEAVPGKLLTPFAPHAIICIGLNYMDHVRETHSTAPDAAGYLRQVRQQHRRPWRHCDVAHRCQRRGRL